ncbi:SNF2 family N-terminal domain-containing protein [Phlyctochytrium arcticum]|nr:SNF2 family N-terminal domain-containing protein [Phlyctochytrium arcticum]
MPSKQIEPLPDSAIATPSMTSSADESVSPVVNDEVTSPTVIVSRKRSLPPSLQTTPVAILSRRITRSSSRLQAQQQQFSVEIESPSAGKRRRIDNERRSPTPLLSSVSIEAGSGGSSRGRSFVPSRDPLTPRCVRIEKDYTGTGQADVSEEQDPPDNVDPPPPLTKEAPPQLPNPISILSHSSDDDIPLIQLHPVASDSEEDEVPLATRRARRVSKGKGPAVVDQQADLEESELSDLASILGIESDDQEDSVPVASSSTSKQKPTRAKRGTTKSKAAVTKGKGKATTKKFREAVFSDHDSESDFVVSELVPSSGSDESELEGDSTTVALEVGLEGEAVGTATVTTPRRIRGRGAAAAAKRQARKDRKGTYDFHPDLITVWDKLEKEVQVLETHAAPQPSDVVIKLLPFQREGLYWLGAQEESRFNGGILADEMGMGKTIQMISLLVTKRMKPNLILAPTVAILQWLAELRERTPADTFKILVFHGTNRPTTKAELEEYDIIISTYAIVEQGYRKMHYGHKRKGETVKTPSLLHSVHWARVILDEAHAIKDRSCSTARAVFSLQRSKQWSLSGTPLQNRVGELYSLIRFMNADPFSYYFCKRCPCKMQTWTFTDKRHCDGCGHTGHQHFCWWNAEILKPIQKYGGAGEGLVAFKKLGCLLDRIMLRRTKVERTEELGLPPRVVVVRRDVFNEAEEELYESLYTDSARTFSTYVRNETVLNNYASIFSLLSRMRLAVNHPDLVTTRLALNDKSAQEFLICGICHDPAEDPILSRCKHVFCREDVRQYLQSAPDGESVTCPVCYVSFTIDVTQPEYEPKKGSTTQDRVKQSIVNHIDMSTWRSSSKIEALVEELTSLQKQDVTLKSIVFSQFVAFLDLIQWRLSRAGFSVVKLDGRMTPAARDTVIKKFMTDVKVTVFLVSLKAGGVALNLTEASRVFVMDPWWNPAVEDQAFDRIHRLGQHRPIKITRMIIENSIESRILQLQEKKKALFDSTVGKDMEALAKLSEEDLQFLFVL